MFNQTKYTNLSIPLNLNLRHSAHTGPHHRAKPCRSHHRCMGRIIPSASRTRPRGSPRGSPRCLWCKQPFWHLTLLAPQNRETNTVAQCRSSQRTLSGFSPTLLWNVSRRRRKVPNRTAQHVVRHIPLSRCTTTNLFKTLSKWYQR